MKIISAAAVSALIFVGGTCIGYADDGQGQDSGDPFHGKTDSGDDAHVLPTPDVLLGKGGVHATIAPKNTSGKATVFPAPYGSGNLINHG